MIQQEDSKNKRFILSIFKALLTNILIILLILIAYGTFTYITKGNPMPELTQLLTNKISHTISLIIFFILLLYFINKSREEII